MTREDLELVERVTNAWQRFCEAVGDRGVSLALVTVRIDAARDFLRGCVAEIDPAWPPADRRIIAELNGVFMGLLRENDESIANIGERGRLARRTDEAARS